MGGSASVANYGSPKSISTSQELILTDVQKDMLNETWKKAMKDAGVEALGQEIFYRILIGGRKIRQLFALEMISDEKLRSNEKFIDHADKIGNMLGRLVNTYIVDPLKFRKDAQKLAGTHFSKLKVGFNPMYWSIFPTILGEVMSLHTPDAQRSSGGMSPEAPIGKVREDCKEAWITFADIMVDVMQAAYITSGKTFNRKEGGSLWGWFGFGKKEEEVDEKTDKKGKKAVVTFHRH